MRVGETQTRSSPASRSRSGTGEQVRHTVPWSREEVVVAVLGEAETGFVEGAVLELSLGARRGIQVQVGTRIEPSRQKDQPGEKLKRLEGTVLASQCIVFKSSIYLMRFCGYLFYQLLRQ